MYYKYQVLCGDVDALGHGCTYVRKDGDAYEVFEIQPVVAYVGSDAEGVGFPFWSVESYHDLDDLQSSLSDGAAMRCCDVDFEGVETVAELTEPQRLELVYACHSYGERRDQGVSGWSTDLPLGELGIDESDGLEADREFRVDVLGIADWISYGFDDESEALDAFTEHFVDSGILGETADAEGFTDYPMRRECWNNLIDSEVKDGKYPECAGEWGLPDKWDN